VDPLFTPLLVLADSLSTGFDTVYECEDHLFATHFPEYSIEKVKQSKNHYALIIKMNGFKGIEIDFVTSL
tara:strand:- start:92 stop:301 length:210 start_codon:yes stop_codon:yes gene_type:complete